MKKPIINGLLCAVLIATVVPIAVLAQSDGGEGEDFTVRCVRAQNNLKGPVRERDIRTRVDRLQAYRYIEKRLDIFTQRLEYNNQPGAQGLRTQVQALELATSTFAANYEAYDARRDALAAMPDCGKRPQVFQTQLNDLRHLRATINQDVLNIQNSIDSNVRNELSSVITQLEADQAKPKDGL